MIGHFALSDIPGLHTALLYIEPTIIIPATMHIVIAKKLAESWSFLGFTFCAVTATKKAIAKSTKALTTGIIPKHIYTHPLFKNVPLLLCLLSNCNIRN